MRTRLQNLLLRARTIPRGSRILLGILTLETGTRRIAIQVLTETSAVELETVGLGASTIRVFFGSHLGNLDHCGKCVGGISTVCIANGTEWILAIDAFASAHTAFNLSVEADTILLQAAVK